ncbi:MAG: DUF1353 domain-containing protein [Flavobacteriales bacterium]|nr:DUF1353 domain-containing protein [Flavobacteriales bacterium]
MQQVAQLGNTLNYKRASLVHDVLYQLLRMEELPQSLVIPVDKLFQKILTEDGMSRLRAWSWHTGLRWAKGIGC